jgi:indole-3-glycerol phosphate synthase
MNNPIFIAEIKTRSPFGFESGHSFYELASLAIKHGDWISVHVDALWGGDANSLSFVRNLTNKPLLAKGFHHTDEDVEKSLDHGADYVLVVDRLPPIRIIDRCIIEVSDYTRFKSWTNIFPDAKFLYNNRDLKTGQVKRGEWAKYKRCVDWLGLASGIVHPSQIYPDASAFIVGAKLPEYLRAVEYANKFK